MRGRSMTLNPSPPPAMITLLLAFPSNWMDGLPRSDAVHDVRPVFVVFVVFAHAAEAAGRAHRGDRFPRRGQIRRPALFDGDGAGHRHLVAEEVIQRPDLTPNVAKMWIDPKRGRSPPYTFMNLKTSKKVFTLD